LFDRWVDNQDSPTQESFNSFAKECYSLIESYLYARFTGYSGSISSCEAWLNNRYPKPDHRKVLLDEILEMQEDLRKLREDIENCAVKRDAGVARIAAMQKELRSTIGQVETYTSNKDRKGLLMAGADSSRQWKVRRCVVVPFNSKNNLHPCKNKELHLRWQPPLHNLPWVVVQK
jgi:hypothetical protein